MSDNVTRTTVPVPLKSIHNIVNSLLAQKISDELREDCRLVDAWVDGGTADQESEVDALVEYANYLRNDYFKLWSDLAALENVPAIKPYHEWLHERPRKFRHDSIYADWEELNSARERISEAEAKLETAMMQNYQPQYLDASRKLGKAKLSLRVLGKVVQEASNEAVNGATESFWSLFWDIVALSGQKELGYADSPNFAGLQQAVRDEKFDFPTRNGMVSHMSRLMRYTSKVLDYLDEGWPDELAGPTRWNKSNRGAFAGSMVYTIVTLCAIANDANIDLDAVIAGALDVALKESDE